MTFGFLLNVLETYIKKIEDQNKLLEQYKKDGDIDFAAKEMKKGILAGLGFEVKEQKDNVALKNLLSGKTKEGIFGDEFFVINEKLIDLSKPLISEEGKELVRSYYSESLDPDGRGHRNLIRMMMDDGFFKYLPKGDDAWVNFLKPFLKLSRKEKTNFRNKTKK